MKIKSLSRSDQHKLAVFFALHYHANKPKMPGPKDIGRVVMSTFGLVTKTGKFDLTPSGKRALKLAEQD